MPVRIRDEDKDVITRKMYALYARYGFDGISMDEIAKQVQLSKATVYKYFNSKENIVQHVVEYMVGFLDNAEFDADHGLEGTLKAFSDMYSKGLLVTSYSGMGFMPYLRNKFPPMYERYLTSFHSFMDRFVAFYRQAVEKGYCRNLCVELIGQQFRNMLPFLLDAEFLESTGLTQEQAIREYYKIFLSQFLCEKYVSVTEKEETYAFIEPLLKHLDWDFLQ